MGHVSIWWILGYGAARMGIGMHDIFFNAMGNLFLRSYGLPFVLTGFLSNERSFIGSALLPLLGAASDRMRTPLGRRRPLMLLVLPVVVGFMALSARPDLWLVVLIFLLGPLFLGLSVMGYEVLLPDCVVPGQRGTVNGMARLLGFLSAIGLNLVASQLWEAQPGFVFLLVAAGLALGFAVTLLTIQEPEPIAAPPPVERIDPLGYLRGLIAQREATKYVASYFCFWLGLGGITPFITSFGHEELGIPEGETLLLLLAVLATTMLFVAPAGWLGDRVGKKPVTSWGLLAFGLLILVGSQVQTRDQAILALALAGIGQAVPTALSYPLFTELVPGRRMGELTGISTMIWSIAQPLGATGLGALADLTGSLRTVLVGGALAILASWAVLQTVRVHPAAIDPPPTPAESA